MSEGAIRLPVAALSVRTGFRANARYSTGGGCSLGEPAPEKPDNAPDPLETAYAKGFAAGAAASRAEADEEIGAAELARERLSLSFAKLDRQLDEGLRLRLRETIAALCETAIAPLALDGDALIRRIDTALSMLARADDERLIRLHPDDISIISDRMKDHWQIEADPALERGALRVESTMGGVEDGPATWRAMIEEAVRRC